MRRGIFSLIFIAVLILPITLWIAAINGPRAAGEAESSSPGLNPDALMEKDYYLAWDQYFKQGISMGGEFTLVKNWLDYHLFRTTDSPEIYVGQEGWLYDRDSMQDVRKSSCHKLGWVAQRQRELLAIDQVLRAKGGRFIFAVAPNKATVYPENVGPVPQDTQCGKSLYDLWIDRQKIQPLPGFIRLDERLGQSKTRGKQVYDPGGSYWNLAGARIAAQVISDFLFQGNSDEILDPDNLTRKLLDIREDDQAEIPNANSETSIEKLESLLIYGGEHTALLLPFLAVRFERVDAINSYCLPSYDFSEVLEAYDVVLLMPSENELEDLCLDLDRIMNELKLDSLAGTNKKLPLSIVSPRNQISLSPLEDGIAVKSMGPDALMQLDNLPGSDITGVHILKLTLEAPVADTLNVTFDTDHGQRLSRTINRGINHLYIPLPPAQRISLLINPGRTTGLFKLMDISVLGINFQESPSSFSVWTKEDPMLTYKEPDIPQVLQKEKILQEGLPDKESKKARDPSISLNDFADGQIFQRIGSSADITISGSYTGTPHAIEAAVFRDGFDGPFIPWTVIDINPLNNVFMGVLYEVPQGGWYRVAVRFSDKKHIRKAGSASWGVGILVACIGQSNMREWFCTGMDLKAHSLLRRNYKEEWSRLGPEGNGAISFGNRLIRREGIPVGLLDYGINGSGLCKKADYGAGYWADQSKGSIYRRFIEGVASTGGVLEYVIWMQGEADAGRVTMTEREYEENLVGFIEQQVRSDIKNGSSREKLPFLIIGLPQRNGGDTKTYRAVREAQIKVAQSVPECYMAASTLDLPHLGRQHLTPEAYIVLGKRVAETVLSLSDKEDN